MIMWPYDQFRHQRPWPTFPRQQRSSCVCWNTEHRPETMDAIGASDLWEASRLQHHPCRRMIE